MCLRCGHICYVPWDEMCLDRGKHKELVNVACHVVEHVLSCNSDFLADWRANKFQVDITTFGDVLYRFRHRIALFVCAYNVVYPGL